MEIKEVEKLLSVSRSNIRFYEKEGLISPKRRENNYRDYSDEDVAKLKKIIAMRKIGFTVEEILLFQKGELPLTKAIEDNKIRLEEEIKQLNGALKTIKKLSKECSSFEEIDGEYYWDYINQSESTGEQFIDICKDYLMFEMDIMDKMWENVFLHNFKKSRKKYGIAVALGILLLICIIRGVSKVLIWHESFWSGFLYPFILFAVCSVILLPIYILNKKAPKVASVISTVLSILAVVFVSGVILYLLFGIVKKMFF